MLAKDDTVLALLRATGTHEEDVFDMTVIHVMKVVGGKVVDMKIIPTNQYAFDEFWS